MNQIAQKQNEIIRNAILLWRKNPSIQSWDAVLDNSQLIQLHEMIYNTPNLTTMQKIDDTMNSAPPLYPKETFQDYINSKINQITPSEYTQYVYNMNTVPNFKNNLYKKYQKNEQIKSIKNHVISEMLRYSINRVPEI